MKTSDQIDKIAPAFLAAQRKVKSAHKISDNPFFKSKYADLSSVADACRDALHANDIAVLQPPSSSDGVVYGVETILMHSSGQWFSDSLMLKPVKSDPQSAGSAITYARRYGLAGMVFIMADDDDGNAASKGIELYSGTDQQKLKLAEYAHENGVTDPAALREIAAVMIKQHVALSDLQKEVKHYINTLGV